MRAAICAVAWSAVACAAAAAAAAMMRARDEGVGWGENRVTSARVEVGYSNERRG